MWTDLNVADMSPTDIDAIVETVKETNHNKITTLRLMILNFSSKVGQLNASYLQLFAM